MEKKLYKTTNAKTWAINFINVVETDPELAFNEEFVTGWFANAIETARKIEKRNKEGMKE